MFFKKNPNGIIQSADVLQTQEGELTEENHADFTYPTTAGWRYFSTPEKAYAALNISETAVTSLQGMLAIKQAGLITAFQSWLSKLDSVADFETIAYFQRAPLWHRNNPLLITGATAMGLTDSQIDNLFALAKTL